MFKTIIKIISPILYIIFFVPIVVTVLSILDSSENFPDLFGETVLIIVTYLLIFLSITLMLWLANKLLIKLEDLDKPKLFDHFRQSLFYYFLISIALYKLIIDVCSIRYEGDSICYFWLYLCIVVSLWAIGINAILLLSIKR